ncbi:6-pyruvoyl trahydropterin synthase family protein [Flagellimonas pacifica]|uniref:6-carboxy-5,6,7,8-tetrahydropterin synthase n=1 Tax=Flagellimonas pacifica TaxID=1247520 RepID=A0A285MWC7_9FLAO|nr:6-carboxytetrahydropterin synthase [Allomuricauda parva]SNZ01495.1 6-pyruvoyltetrahydropterin/6-carboxytetrahydropterin synthase [Allomuricauda parva]
MIATICRKAHFNAAHRLHNPKWSQEKNIEVFGKCNSPNYHGHNFDLEVRIRGNVNPDTGFVMDLAVLGNLIQKEIEDRFDHKNLNEDCPEFENLLPSTEHFVKVIYDILKPKLEKDQLLHITLYETKKNSAEYGDW